MLLSLQSMAPTRRRRVEAASLGFIPPYAIPSTVNTSVLIGSNTLVSVKPASHSNSQITNAVFSSFGGPAYVPTFSTAGALVYSCFGGHNDPAVLGTAYFDFTTGTWGYYAPGNGLTESPSPPGFGVEVSTDSYLEMVAATGQFPAPPHPYGTLCYLNEGSQGSIIWITRAAAGGDNFNSNAVHKMDLSTRTWQRAGNGLMAGAGYDNIAHFDSVDGRYYLLPNGGLQGSTSLRYWRLSDNTPQQTATFSAPTGVGGTPGGGLDEEQRVLYYHIGSSLQAFNLNNFSAGATMLFNGTAPAISARARWVKHKGYWWAKLSNTGNDLMRFDPGANPLGGTGSFSTVTIGGAGLPDYSGFTSHHSGLCKVPALDGGQGLLAWIYSGAANGVALIKV